MDKARTWQAAHKKSAAISDVHACLLPLPFVTTPLPMAWSSAGSQPCSPALPCPAQLTLQPGTQVQLHAQWAALLDGVHQCDRAPHGDGL